MTTFVSEKCFKSKKISFHGCDFVLQINIIVLSYQGAMNDLDDTSILSNIKERFQRKQIYVSCLWICWCSSEF